MAGSSIWRLRSRVPFPWGAFSVVFVLDLFVTFAITVVFAAAAMGSLVGGLNGQSANQRSDSLLIVMVILLAVPCCLVTRAGMTAGMPLLLSFPIALIVNSTLYALGVAWLVKWRRAKKLAPMW